MDFWRRLAAVPFAFAGAVLYFLVAVFMMIADAISGEEWGKQLLS